METNHSAEKNADVAHEEHEHECNSNPSEDCCGSSELCSMDNNVRRSIVIADDESDLGFQLAHNMRDRFGFIIMDDEDEGSYLSNLQKTAEVDAVSLNSRRQKETEREKKWIKMMHRWNFTLQYRKRKLRRRIIKGVPDAFRGQLWYNLLEADLVRDQFSDCSQIDITSIPSRTIDEVDDSLFDFFSDYELCNDAT